jgi:hypothetical protein
MVKPAKLVARAAARENFCDFIGSVSTFRLTVNADPCSAAVRYPENEHRRVLFPSSGFFSTTRGLDG